MGDCREVDDDLADALTDESSDKCFQIRAFRTKHETTGQTDDD